MAVSVQLHEWYPCGERGLQKEVSYTPAAVCSSYCGVCYRAVAGVCMRELVAMALTRYRQRVHDAMWSTAAAVCVCAVAVSGRKHDHLVSGTAPSGQDGEEGVPCGWRGVACILVLLQRHACRQW